MIIVFRCWTGDYYEGFSFDISAKTFYNTMLDNADVICNVSRSKYEALKEQFENNF